MTGEYRTAKGWRIFSYILAPLLIALFFFLGTVPFLSEQPKLALILLMVPMSIGMVIVFAYGLAEMIVGKITITLSSISQKGLFGVRQLAFNEIKGYKSDQHYIHIIPKESGQKRLKLSNYLEKSAELSRWITINFIDLNSHEALEEEKNILANDEFGITPASREYRLKEAKKVSAFINGAGIAVFFWLLISPKPYDVALTIGIVLPLIALAALYFYRGLIRFDEKKGSAHPSITFGFLFPGMALILRGALDYELMHYNTLIVATAISSFALMILILSVTREIRFKKGADFSTALTFIIMTSVYTSGAYIISNCLYDKSEPEIYTAKVMDKEMSKGKTTTYYLTLGPWGPRTGPEQVSVTSADYDAIDVGEEVDVYLRQGLLQTPWFYVSEKKPL